MKKANTLQKLKQLSRWGLSIFALFSLLLFGFVGIFYISLFTEPGRDFVNRMIVERLEDKNLHVEIGPVTGSPPTKLLFSSIQFSDKEGKLMEIKDLEFVWNPLSLFRGRIQINKLDAKEVLLTRLPKSSKEEQEVKLTIPKLPISVALQNLSIHAFKYNALDLGMKADLNCSFIMPKMRANLEVKDSKGADLLMKLSYNHAQNNLSFFSHLFDSGSGLISDYLDLKEPTNIVVKGDGPFEHWKADLTSNFGQEAVLLGNAIVGLADEKLHVQTNLRSQFFTHFQPFLKKALEDRLQADLSFFVDKEGLHLENGNIESPVVQVRFLGETMLSSSQIEGSSKAFLTFKKPFMIGEGKNAFPLQTDLALDIKPKGNWDALEVQLGGNLKSAPLQLPSYGKTKDIDLAIEADLSLRHLLTQQFELDVDADVDVLGFTSEHQGFVDPKKLMMKLDAKFRLPDTFFAIDGITLLGDDLRAQGSLSIEKGNLSSISLHIDHDQLKRFNPDLEGKASVSLTKETEEEAFHVLLESQDLHFKQYDFESFLTEASFLPKGDSISGFVQTEFGQLAPFKAKSDFVHNSNQLTLQNIAFDENLWEGKLSYDYASSLFQGHLKGSVSQFGFLSPFFDFRPIDGKLFCDLHFFKNSKNVPQFTAQFKVKDLKDEGGELLDIHHGIFRVEGSDYSKQLNAKISATLLDAKYNHFALSQAKCEINGHKDAFSLSLNAKGLSPLAYDINLLGKAEVKPDALMVEMNKWEGRVDQTNYALTKPLLVRYGKGEWHIPQTHLRIGKGVLAGSADLGLLHSKVNASWMDIPSHLFAFLNPSLSFEGGIEGKVDLRKEGQLWNGDVEVATDHWLWKLDQEIKPVFSSKVSGKIKDNIVHLTGSLKEEKLKDSDFKLKGEIPFDFNHAFQLSCIGQFNLSYLSPFLPTYEDVLEGEIKGEVLLSGKMDEPKIEGKIDLQKGYYENAELGTMLDDIQAQITAQGSEIKLVSFSAHDGEKGQINAKGHLKIGGDWPYYCSLSADHFRVLSSDDNDLRALASLELKGQKGKKALLSGKVDVSKASIKIPEKFNQEVDDFFDDEEQEEVEEAQTKSSKADSKLHLDLVLQLTNPLRLTGFGLDSQWEGRFNIAGPALKPSIDGKLSAKKGNFTLLGPTFTLTQGDVYFAKSDKISPELFVSAETKTSDLTAHLNITGNVNKPKIELTSNPALPQDEILARLLFKHGTADLSPLQAVKLGQMLAKFNGSKLPLVDSLDKIQSVLGLEDLDIDTNEEEGKTSNPVLRAGRRINDNVKVIVEEDVKQRKTNGKLQVELTPHVSLETGVSNDLQGNVGIFGKWDY